MKLYYAPGTCALSVWIALEWVGADYEVEKVELGSDEYKKINPLGSVPALDRDQGETMTQASAILKYISERYPEADLGADPSIEDRYWFDQRAAFLTADYHPAFWPLFNPNKYTTSEKEEDLQKVKEAAFKVIDTVTTHLDSLLEGKDHIYKDKKTILDPYAFILARWTEMTPKSWKEYPNLAPFMERMEKDPKIQKVLEESNR